MTAIEACMAECVTPLYMVDSDKGNQNQPARPSA